MATVKLVTVQEQNADMLAGVLVDSTLIGSAGITYRAGRHPGTIVLTGTQTASLAPVILDLANATQGDRFVIKKYTTAVIGTGASQVVVVSGSAAGVIVGAFQIGTNSPAQVSAVFDGVAWR